MSSLPKTFRVTGLLDSKIGYTHPFSVIESHCRSLTASMAGSHRNTGTSSGHFTGWLPPFATLLSDIIYTTLRVVTSFFVQKSLKIDDITKECYAVFFFLPALSFVRCSSHYIKHYWYRVFVFDTTHTRYT